MMSNVFPKLVVLDLAHQGLWDAEAQSNAVLCAQSRPDRKNIGICQSTTSAPFALYSRVWSCRLAPLRNLVGNILGVCAKEEVGYFHAVANVAPMKDVQTVRDEAVCLDPDKAVGPLRAAFPVKVGVPMGIDVSGPQAAAVAIGRRRIVRKPLRQTPVTGCVESLSNLGSHDRAPAAVVVRAGVRVDARPGSPFIAHKG